MAWHLGRFRFNANDVCFLLSGYRRHAYVALTAAGDLCELAVALTPAQARELIHGHKVRIERKLGGLGSSADELAVTLDIQPPRGGERRYRDGQNTYSSDKRRARTQAMQAFARRLLDSAMACHASGQRLEAAEYLAQFREQAVGAWLEAEAYLPWLASAQGDALDFAIMAYADEALREPALRLHAAPQLAAILRAYPEIRGDIEGVLNAAFAQAEALADVLARAIASAQARAWPPIGYDAR